MALVERVAGCRHGGRIAARRTLIVNLTVPQMVHEPKASVGLREPEALTWASSIIAASAAKSPTSTR
jgi:hypothetical protein